ncbi:MAG: methyltransferase domain-containing protein [Candidatus Sumerlaeota bacterium]|nr:methyltransferase domain-containing protein [Candidatus Sumerlaeota bacterium]
MKKTNITSTKQSESATDVRRLMREIQTAVAIRHDRLIESLDDLRRIIAELISRETFDTLSQPQHEANMLFQTLRDTWEEQKARGRDDRLEQFARLPESQPAPWWKPRKWVEAICRQVIARQEPFNFEVIRRLEWLESIPFFEKHFSVTARLIGTLNGVLHRIHQTDLALETVHNSLLERVTMLLEELDSLGRPPVETNILLSGLQSAQSLARAGQLPAGAIRAAGYEMSESLQAAVAALHETAQMREWLAEAAGDLMNQAGAINARVVEMEKRQKNADDRTEIIALRLETAEARFSKAAENLVAQVQATLNNGRMPAAESLLTDKSQPAEKLPENVPVPPFNFLAFEGLTRGTEAAIASEQVKYVPWFSGSSNVLDAGCGRGEFLELLRQDGIDAYGVDYDPQMAEYCAKKGLRVVPGFLYEHIAALPDGSLGGLFLGQVVEHLSPESFAALPALAWRKLKPGSAIVIETINPTCLTTFSGAFYADPTHMKPVHPKALQYYLQSAGFVGLNVIFSAAVDAEHRLAELREPGPIDPAIKEIVLQVNANFARLNSLLYSYANYAIAARKPAKPSQDA